MDVIYQLDGVGKEAGHIAVTFFNEHQREYIASIGGDPERQRAAAVCAA